MVSLPQNIDSSNLQWNRASGKEYQGNWVNGNQDGDGLIIFPNGDERKGFWKKGIRIRWTGPLKVKGNGNGIHIDEDELVPSEIEVCAICLEPLFNGEDMLELDCGHKFHLKCLGGWLERKNQCPICKAPVH